MQRILIVAALLAVAGLLVHFVPQVIDPPTTPFDEDASTPDLVKGTDPSTTADAPTLIGTPRDATPREPTGDGASPETPLPQPPTGATTPMERWKALGYLTTTPATSLEGMVLRGAEQVTDGEGLLWRVGVITSAGEIPVGKPPTRTAQLTDDGTFRFDDLEGAGAWMLGVNLGDGVQRLLYLPRVTGRAPNERVIATLGTGEVFGFVYDADGQPAKEAVIRIGPAGRKHEFIAQVGVDEQGRYRVGHLGSGTTTVSVAFQGDLDDDKQCAYRIVQVRAGESVEASFGSPAGNPLIEGVVQCADGAAVRGPGRTILGFEGGFVSVDYDAAGRFSQRLPAREYSVHIWLPSGGRSDPYGLQEHPLQLRHDTTDLVWVLRGARVQGRVLTRAGTPPAAPVTFVRFTKGNPGATRYAEIASDGTYVAYGMAPGKYTLHVARNGYKAGSAQIEIPENVHVVRKDLTIDPAPKKLQPQ